MACQLGRIDIARFLIEENADKDSACTNGWTPLFAACFCHHIDIACVLIAEGADHELLDNRGKTAFEYLLQRHPNDDLVGYDEHAAKAEVEQALQDYKTLRAFSKYCCDLYDACDQGDYKLAQRLIEESEGADKKNEIKVTRNYSSGSFS